MFCDKCGIQVSDNAKFCPRCGNRLQETESRSIDGKIEIYQKSFEKESKSGKKKWIAIFAGIVLITVVCVVGGIFLYQNLTGEEYLALVRNIDGKYGYINEQGEEVIDCEYDIATDFNAKGVAAVGYKNGETYTYMDNTRDLYDWSLINTRGKEITSLSEYDAVGTLSQNGYICVGKKDGVDEDGNPIFQWGYIDSTGKEKITCKYFRDWLPTQFYGLYGVWNEDGLAAVEKSGGSCVILDEKGEEIIERGNNSTVIFNTSELYFSARQSDTDEDGDPIYEYGYADKDGEEIIPCQFIDAEDFSVNGLAAVEKQTGTDEDGEPVYKWGYINKDGETVLPFIYEDADSFDENGLALVEVEGEIAEEEKFIDAQGKEIITLSDFSYPYSCKDFIIVEEDILYRKGIISLTGEEILPCEYDWIGTLSSDEKRIALMLEEKEKYIYGCADEKGQMILPIKYNMMKRYGDNNWLPAGISSGNFDDDTEIYRCQYFDMEGNEILALSPKYMDANPFYKVK